jgi:defect-in-organelle-trafficking protein DotD
MPFMKKILLPILTLTGLLSGCASHFSDYMPPPPPGGDPAAIQLAIAARSVTSSLTTLEGIGKAENPHYEKNLPDPRGYGMNQLASIDWTGPIGPLVEKLAVASGYRIRVLGSPPPIPIIVAIHAENLPLAVILRNADYQAGEKADVAVYAKQGTIELRYTSA